MGSGASTLESSDGVQQRRASFVNVDASERVTLLQEAINTMTEENDKIKDFVAARDAKLVRLACQGMGTNDALLIEILCKRTKKQLAMVDEKYRAQYQKTLWETVDSECSGNYKKLVRYATLERHEFIGEMVSLACNGIGVNEMLLVEVFHTATNAEIAAMKKYWEAKHDASLTDKLKAELGKDHERLILRLLNGGRQSEAQTNVEEATKQATALYKAGVGKKFGSDENIFLDMFGEVSWAQMTLIKDAYEKQQQMSLQKALEKEFSGQLEKTLVAMLEPPIDFYCSQLKQAMQGMGTGEDTICRILGGNDKAMIAQIKKRYLEKYDIELGMQLKAEISGNFGDAVQYWLDDASDPTMGMERKIELAGPPAAPDSPDKHANILDERLSDLLEENANMKGFVGKVDAKEVRNACSGVGTNETKIINIMCMRTKKQLDCIDMHYREMFGMNLREQLEKELDGNFKDFMVYGQMAQEEFDALLIRKAVQGMGTNEGILIEVLTTRDNARIAKAKEYYEGRFDESLTDRISSETSGHFKTCLLTLLNLERDESTEVDDEVCMQMVGQLKTAGEGVGTDEGPFIEILTRTSRAMITAIQAKYEQEYGASLVSLVKSEFSGRIQETLIALCSDPISYYCYCLKKAFKGMGTDEAAVCRILGGNDKPTVMEIAKRYMEKYDSALAEDLKKELNGNFKNAVLTWVTVMDATEADD